MSLSCANVLLAGWHVTGRCIVLMLNHFLSNVQVQYLFYIYMYFLFFFFFFFKSCSSSMLSYNAVTKITACGILEKMCHASYFFVTIQFSSLQTISVAMMPGVCRNHLHTCTTRKGEIASESNRLDGDLSGITNLWIFN